MLYAMVILPQQKEYPLQLDKKFGNFRSMLSLSDFNEA
jgi:hypothetical protein